MPKIDDPEVYAVAALMQGATWIGTNNAGKTVQFSYDGLVETIKSQHDIVFFGKATRAGQLVAGNLPDDQGGVLADTAAPDYNAGMPFLAVLKVYPPVADNIDNLQYILQQV
jgi:hypothetical protein